jgi:hypothetical protein
MARMVGSGAVVALVHQAMLAQHGFDRDVDGSSRGNGSHHLALEILDIFDRPVGQHHIFLGIIVIDPVLQLVRNDAQILQSGVFDRNRQRRKSKIGDLELAVRERGHHLRRAHKPNRFEQI